MKSDLRDIKSDSIWANLALLLLFPYSFFCGLTRMQGVHIIYPAFIISIVVLLFVGKTCNNRRAFRKFTVLLCFVLVFIVLNIVLVGNSNFKAIIYGVFIMPSLGALLFFYRIRYWTSIILFSGVALFFGTYIIQNGPFVNEQTELLVNSRNYVSFFVLLYSFPYFVHCYDYNKTPSLLVPSICVLISIFALGRGGIIASMGILCGVLYLKMVQKSNKRFIYRIGFVLLLIFIIFIGFGVDFFDTYFSKFSEEGMNSTGRTPSWVEYCKSFNPIHLLLGTPVKSLKFTTAYLEGSLHNSYLTLHAREGIVGLFLIIYMVKGMIILYKQKAFTLFLVLAALLFKGLTDADMGGMYSGGDIYVFYLVLVYFKFSNYKINGRKNISTVSSPVSSNSGE